MSMNDIIVGLMVLAIVLYGIYFLEKAPLAYCKRRRKFTCTVTEAVRRALHQAALAHGGD